MLQKPVSLEANLNIYQFLIVASPAFWVAGGVGACGITPWISWQFILHTHNHSNRQFRVPNWPNVHVFGPWEEVGEARATMLTHGEHALSTQKDRGNQTLNPLAVRPRDTFVSQEMFSF